MLSFTKICIFIVTETTKNFIFDVELFKWFYISIAK